MLMILAIDIGNTNTVIGGFSGDKLCFEARISTDAVKTKDEYAAKLISVLALYNVEKTAIDGAIIASVVPPLNTAVKQAIYQVYGVEPITVGPGIKTGINLLCDDPSTVGADLICGCVAAHYIYGSPALIIDMGTATKIMITNRDGAFYGASIIPGVNIGLRALASGTAQLPQISLEPPSSVIGKNTVDCMLSGVVFGNASMIDGMIDRYAEESGADLKIIATGGLSDTIIPLCRHDIVTDRDLVLKGLNILYKKNK